MNFSVESFEFFDCVIANNTDGTSTVSITGSYGKFTVSKLTPEGVQFLLNGLSDAQPKSHAGEVNSIKKLLRAIDCGAVINIVK